MYEEKGSGSSFVCLCFQLTRFCRAQATITLYYLCFREVSQTDSCIVYRMCLKGQKNITKIHIKFYIETSVNRRKKKYDCDRPGKVSRSRTSDFSIVRVFFGQRKWGLLKSAFITLYRNLLVRLRKEKKHGHRSRPTRENSPDPIFFLSL